MVARIQKPNCVSNISTPLSLYWAVRVFLDELKALRGFTYKIHSVSEFNASSDFTEVPHRIYVSRDLVEYLGGYSDVRTGFDSKGRLSFVYKDRFIVVLEKLPAIHTGVQKKSSRIENIDYDYAYKASRSEEEFVEY